MMGVKKAYNKVEQYLFHRISITRSITLTISLVVLYLLLYLASNKIYYHLLASGRIANISIPRQYFSICFLISTFPLFIFFFCKCSIWLNFWNDMSAPHLIDYLFFGIIILFLYFSFNHNDIEVTAKNGKVLLDIVYRKKNLLDFYEYAQGAGYLLPHYIVFGIWSIPVKLAYALLGLLPIGIESVHISDFTLWWYKLLPTLFYFSSAFVIYKIGGRLGMNHNKSKWMSLIWLISPMAMFSQFIFGQYDSIGMFFELLMLFSFLQKKTLKFSFLCMIAMTFKLFPVFIFIPLLLLIEKRVVKIIGYVAIAMSGYTFLTFLFSGSEYFKVVDNFNAVMLDRLYAVGIGTHFGIISFFLLSFISTCVFSYFAQTDSGNEFAFLKISLFLPLFIYSAFFSFVLFHPQWILILTPYLMMNIFMNKNKKGNLFVTICISFSFLLTTMCNWYHNVDANLVSRGVFSKVFGNLNSGDASTFRSLASVVSFHGNLPSTIYFSSFVGLLLLTIILAFPSEKNIKNSVSVIKEPLSIERDTIWISGLTVLVFAVPSLLLFFAVG